MTNHRNFQASSPGITIPPSVLGQAYLIWANEVLVGLQPISFISGYAGVNVPFCVLSYVPFTITITRVKLRVTVLAGVAATINIGIYSATKNKLIDSGTFNGNSVTTVQTNIISPITLLGGQFYWFVFSQTVVATLALAGLNAGFIVAAEAPATTPLSGTAANLTVGGVLPPTLGTITQLLSGNTGVPFALFEP